MRKIIHRYTVLLLTVLLVGTGIALADTDVIVLGDVNSDDSVNEQDVIALVNYLHGSGAVNAVAADVNRDKAIDIADVTAIKNIISSGTFNKGTASTLFFPAATVNKNYGDAAFKNQLVRSGSTGAITYESSAPGVATVNTTTGEVTIQGAGTATITATLAGNGSISGTTASYTVNVAKVAASITTSPASVAGDLTYDGTAQNLVTAGDAPGGTLKYFVNTSGEVPTTETDGWTDVVSTGTDADTYYVWYYVAGDANHTNTAVTAIEGNTKAISKFNLTNAAIATEIGDQQYAGAQVTPAAPAIKLGESTIDASNYDVSYGENNSVGTGTVIYTAKAGSANFSGVKMVDFTIASGTLTVTATDYSGAYDGTAHGITVTCDGATIKYRTTAEGEYNLTENPTYTDAGDARTVYYQVTKDNYTTVTGSKTVTITQKEVTVNGITASNKTYDGNTTATLVCTEATISGKVESDDLTVTATGTFADANVGTGKTVTISDITLGGASAANYKLAASGNQESTTADITAASFTPVVTLSGWTYGSPNDPSVDETNTSGGTVTYYYKTGDAEWTTTQPTDAGTHQVKASIAANGNYEAAESAPVEFTITQKALTITANAQTISYGSSIATGTGQVTADGLVDGDALTAVILTPSTEQVTTSGTITPSAATTTNGISNYSVTYNTGTLTINKVAASVTTAPTGKTSLTYTGEAQELVDATSAAYTGGTLVYSKTENGTYGAASTITETNAGTYSFWYKVQGDGNHDDSTPVEITGVVITQKALTITANAQTISYGSSIATGTGQVTADGLVDGDALTAVTLTPSTDQVTTSGTITPSAAATTNGISNYSVTYNTGTLTINKVAASVTTAPTGKTSLTYTGEAQELVDATSAAYTGGTLVYSKTENGTYGAASTITETNAGTYSFWYKVQGDGNHDDSTPVEITGVVIGKAALSSLSVSMSGWTYGGTATSPSVSNNSGSGTVTYNYKVSTAPDNTYSATKPSNAGTYTVRASVAETANYNAGTATANFTIAKAALSSLSVSMSGWTYGGTATSPSVSNNSGSGTVTYNYKVSTEADNTYSTTKPTNAGTYTVRASVAETANYNAGTATANFTIAKAALSSLSVSMSGWTYGGTATSPSVSNNSGSGTVTYNYKVSTAPDNTYSATKPSNAGTYTVRASVAETANYNAGTATANFTIAKAAGAATLSPSSVAFGTSTTNKTVTVSGNTGTVSATVPSGSGCTVNVSGSTITITRTSNSAFSATVTVTIAATTNYNSTTKSISVSGTAAIRSAGDVESETMGSYNCAKIWTSASGGYYVVCTDKATSATWSTARGYSETQGGKTFTCGTKDQWNAIMSACGGTGFGCINSKCSSVTGWSNMSEIYWSSSEYSNNTANAWYFFSTNWNNFSKDGSSHVRLVSAF